MTKTKRGLGNDSSAQVFADLSRISHNYLRPHTGLPNNVTPAEAAGINLKLGDNKLKNLIEQSAEAKEQAKKEFQLEPQLGKRIEFIDIKHERDCISVRPKS